MPFKPFAILKQDPKDGRCLARIRSAGNEAYCEQPASNGSRCPAHDTRRLVHIRWAKVRQAKEAAKSLTERVQAHGPGNLSLNLEHRIAALNALLESLEAKSPLVTDDQKLIGTLNKTLAELVQLHLRLANPGANVVDAAVVHHRALALFDRLIPTEAIRHAVIEGFGTLLDELVQRPAAMTSETTNQECHANEQLC